MRKQSARATARRLLERLAGRQAPPVGHIDMGDLARTTPISRNFGFDRGTPIDRYYIEQFLKAHSADLRGRVLEIGDSRYSEKFGSGITRLDVLHVRDEPGATIVGDLTNAGCIPHGAFDCIIAAQVLQYVHDLAAAVAELRRGLGPCGVALITLPGISSAYPESWGGQWYWSFGEQTVRRLFGDSFSPENVDVRSYGNVYAATCFLHGLAVEEVDRDRLDERDAAYPVTLAVRARKRR